MLAARGVPADAMHPVIANAYGFAQNPVEIPHPKAGSPALASAGAAAKVGVTVGTTARD